MIPDRLYTAISPKPGDFAVVNTGSMLSVPIEIGEWLTFSGKSFWDHAVICSRVENGIVYIVEATTSGAREIPWHYNHRPFKWSTGIIDTPVLAGEAAREYIGVGYSWLDYYAIAAHSWHLPAPGLRRYIETSKHMICSQLVDQAEKDAGKQLFSDNRWPGYVRPSDLGHLIGA